MELKTYLEIMWRRRWIILLVTITLTAAFLVATFIMPPTYQATTTVRVATAVQGSPDYQSTNVQYADRLMNTYVKIATSGPLLDELDKALVIAEPPKITVSTMTDAELLQITVEDADPALAAQAANKLAELLVGEVKKSELQVDQAAQQALDQQIIRAQADVNQARLDYQAAATADPLDQAKVDEASQALAAKQEAYVNLLSLQERMRAMLGVRTNSVTVVERATIPQSPSSPRKVVNLALGLLVGLCLGVALAFLLENLDSTLYSTERIQTITQLPLLGAIPVSRVRRGHGFLNGTSPEGEAFRHVRTKLLNMTGGDGLRTLLVTSAEPGEGKSTIAANLAYSLAQAGRRVVIVDCDLRIPQQHMIFHVPNDRGLSDVLVRQFSPRGIAVKNEESGVWVIPSGPPVKNPVDALGSPAMKQLLSELSTRFDTILVDSTSLLAVADASVLAPMVDAVVVVVARGRIGERSARNACELLRESHAKPVAVVINRAGPGHRYGYYRSGSRFGLN